MDYREALQFMECLGRNSVYVVDEENTKRTIIEPIIEYILGYKIPMDVTLENTADIGIKAGEKVDYAIKINGLPKIIVEAKGIHEDITEMEYVTQLYRYFVAIGAEIGIITNGVNWHIYTDTQRANIMDLEPVYTFNINSYGESDHKLLCGISKGSYVKESVLQYKREKKAESKAETARLEQDYEASQAINNYLKSAQFIQDIAFRCELGLYSEDKLRELVRDVINGSYVLKYAKVEQSRRSKVNISLLEASNNPVLLDGLAVTKLRYTQMEKEGTFRDIKELPYVAINLLKAVISNSIFEETMSKQAQVKKWIKKHDYTKDLVEVGMQTVNGYDVLNAKNAAEALKRTVQIIKVFKINPLWFILEE